MKAKMNFYDNVVNLPHRPCQFQALINIVGQPILHSHIPTSHSCTNCWSEICSIFIYVVNSFKVILNFCIFSRPEIKY